MHVVQLVRNRVGPQHLLAKSNGKWRYMFHVRSICVMHDVSLNPFLPLLKGWKGNRLRNVMHSIMDNQN